MDDHTRIICLDLYEQIEGEALDLFEPLERIPLVEEYEAKSQSKQQRPSSSPRKKLAPWEILTPMRQKRQWTSPRSRINMNRAGAAEKRQWTSPRSRINMNRTGAAANSNNTTAFNFTVN